MKKARTQVENFGYTVKNLDNTQGGIGEEVSGMVPGRITPKTVTQPELANLGSNIYPVYKTY